MTKSDSEQPPKNSQNTPENRLGKKKPERKNSTSILWYSMILIIIVVVLFSLNSGSSDGKAMKYSEFINGLDPDGELAKKNQQSRFDKKNVYELVIDLYKGNISFQDQPKGSTKKITKYRVNATGMPETTVQKLQDSLSSKGIAYSFSERPSDWSMFYLFLIPLLFLVFFIFIFRRMGGAGSAMSFSRNRGRMYAQEDIDVNFKNVAGIDEAVEELKEVVGFLQNPGKYQALGGRIPRGVLLVGPPGTGKTLLAKAVAGEAGVPFFSLSGSDFVELFVGVGAARVRDLFQQSAQRSPSIIFIDELDALGKTRGSGGPGGHDEREQTLNALLVEMDGFSSDLSVIVIGATNRPETLDPALMRPGRFDRHVMVDRPDIKGREAILKVHSTKIKMDENVDLSRLAKMSPGFVGADLANIVNEAALLAARNEKNRVTMAEFEEGIERVMAGLEKQTRIIHEDERQRIAYHECGHALVACSLPHTDPVHKISIIPRGMGLGYTLHIPEDERQLQTQSELKNKICCLLGGISSEEMVFGEHSTGAQNDLQRATEIARRMITDFGMSPKLGRVHYAEIQRSAYFGITQGFTDTAHSEDTIREIDLEIKRIIDEASETVHEILTNRRDALEHMSRELVECEVMNAEHLKKILDQYKTSPQISPGTRTSVSCEENQFSPPPIRDELKVDDEKKESI